MTIFCRPAEPSDATQMCDLINKIIAIGGTTAHRTPFDGARILADYIAHPLSIACMVADKDGLIVGFQSIDRGDSEWGGAHPVPPNWGIIASFVADGQQGQGIGQQLFAATLERARAAKLVAIDATIRRENTAGLAYYSGLGFVDYCERGGAVGKAFHL